MSRPAPAWRLVCVLWLALCAAAAWAQTAAPSAQLPHARLDRDRVGIDESFTLIVEIEGMRAGERFDISPLRDRGDFIVLRQDNSQDVRLIGGRNRMRMIYSFELAAQRTGRLTVPPLRVGDRWTRALTVTVLEAGERGPPPAIPAGREAFIDSRVDESAPYVQQSVGYTLRLYYDGDSLIDGSLTQDPPQNADLFKIGEDLHYHRQLGDRLYKVLERRYSLVPARPGPVVLPAARFEGRSARTMFDDLMRSGGGALRVAGPRHVLRARPIPAQAPQPWLPLRGLRMQWLEAPPEIRGGEASTVTLRLVADGAGVGQLPEPELRVVSGDAQVFADAARSEERFVDGRLQITLIRSFSVVPSTPGQTLVLRAPALTWWDTTAAASRASRLQDLRLPVGAGGQTAALGAAAARDADVADPPTGWRRGFDRRWDVMRAWYAEEPGLRLAWTLLLCSWGVVMGVLLLARLRASRRRTPAPAAAEAAAAAQAFDAVALRRLFAAGDLADIARTLCALAAPPAPDLDRLRARLADPAQREAIVLLQRARWGAGDPVDARRALRDAFAEGPRWRSAPPTRRDSPLLPPLYPV